MTQIVLFCHSLRSDWNHGNAHFLRGISGELHRRGFDVHALEPQNGWSATHLAADQGPQALTAWRAVYPDLPVTLYDPWAIDLDRAADGADVVVVHEWTDPALVARLAARRRSAAHFLLFFLDTHHRMVSAPGEMAMFDLDGFDAVLAFGAALSEAYRRRGWGRRVFIWHEGADLHVFRPHPEIRQQRDLVWIGNWGDDERAAELHEFLIEPVSALGLSARVHGVRYPVAARAALAAAGIEYPGYLPNFAAPLAFAAARMTVHIPRRPYARVLPGIPTIRMFEALACGIPLVSAPWSDYEQLFPADCYLRVATGAQMEAALSKILTDRPFAEALAAGGLNAIESRHTCGHRANELVAIVRALGSECATATRRQIAS